MLLKCSSKFRGMVEGVDGDAVVGADKASKGKHDTHQYVIEFSHSQWARS